MRQGKVRRLSDCVHEYLLIGPNSVGGYGDMYR
jgi:hypothetical protein